MRQRDSQLSARGECSGDAGYDFIAHARSLERGDLLLRAAEEHRVAALEPDHDGMRLGGIDQSLVDELLCRGMFSAALADRDLLRARGQCDRLRMHQSVMKDDVGLLEQLCRAQGQQVRCTGAGTDEINDAAHATNPPATVLFVVSSMRMKLPVARLSA